jgi:hypothetical protein
MTDTQEKSPTSPQKKCKLVAIRKEWPAARRLACFAIAEWWKQQKCAVRNSFSHLVRTFHNHKCLNTSQDQTSPIIQTLCKGLEDNSASDGHDLFRILDHIELAELQAFGMFL